MSGIAPATSPALPPRGPLERFLQLFTEVRGGEGAPLLLLTLNVFLILAAYYVMKPVRQALILVHVLLAANAAFRTRHCRAGRHAPALCGLRRWP